MTSDARQQRRKPEERARTVRDLKADHRRALGHYVHGALGRVPRAKPRGPYAPRRYRTRQPPRAPILKAAAAFARRSLAPLRYARRPSRGPVLARRSRRSSRGLRACFASMSAISAASANGTSSSPANPFLRDLVASLRTVQLPGTPATYANRAYLRDLGLR